MKGLSSIVKVVLVVLIVFLALFIFIGIYPSPVFNPQTQVCQCPPQIIPAKTGLVLVEYNRPSYPANVTINVCILVVKYPPMFVNNVSVNGVPVKITFISDVYNDTKSNVVYSTDPKAVPIDPGFNDLIVKGILLSGLNFTESNVTVTITFSNGVSLKIPIILNVT